ncbi:MAG: N5-glutamine methyltransferase family protein [Saprospiraceae bacterium]
MSSNFARAFLIEQLSPRYGEGEARAIARIVFEDAFDRGRAFEEERFEKILSRLAAGEPVQYVLGEADFFGLKFKVSPAVLIPRQETEELVAWVLEHLPPPSPPPKGDKLASPTLLDIGLGSGCIGITLKKKMPGLQLFGLEKSPAALAIAVENAERILSELGIGNWELGIRNWE